ncbi:hypothetical protein HU200_023775 [Digitaria exilis]|uniref:Uncharacterized protein n=1 Tax=Digitaria exilis TaxID=1010633 RepID=A0A835CBH5_9POAL|nr:hypothetical protein HU200_023775 [Digitaria exilis]
MAGADDRVGGVAAPPPNPTRGRDSRGARALTKQSLSVPPRAEHAVETSTAAAAATSRGAVEHQQQQRTEDSAAELPQQQLQSQPNTALVLCVSKAHLLHLAESFASCRQKLQACVKMTRSSSSFGNVVWRETGRTSGGVARFIPPNGCSSCRRSRGRKTVLRANQNQICIGSRVVVVTNLSDHGKMAFKIASSVAYTPEDRC